jgi:hypothetical protein
MVMDYTLFKCHRDNSQIYITKKVMNDKRGDYFNKRTFSVIIYIIEI